MVAKAPARSRPGTKQRQGSSRSSPHLSACTRTRPSLRAQTNEQRGGRLMLARGASAAAACARRSSSSLLLSAGRPRWTSGNLLGTSTASSTAHAATTTSTRHLSSSTSTHMAGTSTWDGTSLSQEDFMQKDQCILVDDQDRVLGSTSKYDCHRFVPGQPTGILHRAFSVFLFDSQNRLLLQQRAACKITFPKVWTNTCCSHQLSGQSPSELDEPHHISEGSVPGAKRAAVRKLEHELGIRPAQLPADSFTFLTRLHYCAADTRTWGPQAEWGEHEMDYILLARADVEVQPNPEEVDAIKYVTLPELQAMMEPSTGNLWSPWFRIIATRFLPTWWGDLDAALGSSKHQDLGTIHHIQPAPDS